MKNSPKRETVKSGLVVHKDELRVVWDFFDPKGTQQLTAADLKKKLSVFYKNITIKDIKFLLNNQPQISFDELYALLRDNQVSNFDPVREAFKIYDPHDTGYVDISSLKLFFKQLGYGDLTDEDAKILLATADTDRDGRIGLDDFRAMVPFSYSHTTNNHDED